MAGLVFQARYFAAQTATGSRPNPAERDPFVFDQYVGCKSNCSYTYIYQLSSVFLINLGNYSTI